MKTNYFKNYFSFLSLLFMAIGISYAQPQAPSGKKWEKVDNLSDEFNGNFDTNKWEKVLWDYPNTPTKMIPENSGVSGGNLWIKATLGPDPLFFQSSRIYSKAQISYPMYTESSIITAHLSAYNTFWLNNGNIDGRDEIDVIENNSRPSCGCQPNFPYQMNSQYFQATNGFTVRNADNFDNRNLSNGNPKKGIRWNEAYHTVGVWWKDAKNMTFYLDGEKAGSVVVGEDRGGRNYPEIQFSRDLNLIWDLWTDDENFLGGVAVKSHLQDNSINTMRVDWVHTYRLVNGDGGGTPQPPTPPTPTPNPTPTVGGLIEAENFVRTGGTFNDGQVPLGVNKTNRGINYVNAGDYAEYEISIEAGTYAITYQISTPMDNAEITFKADGNTVSRDAVSNNGQWDTYQPLRAGSNVTLSAGRHTIRIEASGSNQWQWNLDKIELSKVGTTPNPNPTPIPTPPTGNASLVVQAENFTNTGGTFGGFQTYTTGGVTATNFNQTGDWAEYSVNIPQNGSYNVEYFISTPLSGPAIEFILDGVSQMKDNVANNGSWDNFTSMKASRAVNLSAGTHVIRLLGAGTNGWEWNLDRFILTSGNGAKNSDLDTSALRIYPNPANESFNVTGFGNQELVVSVYDVRGVQYANKVVNASDSNIQINNLARGVYIVRISKIDGSSVLITKVLKN